MVVPLNLKPLLPISLLIISLISVLAGRSFRVLRLFTIVFPWVKLRTYVSKEPNSFCISRKRCALFIVAWILSLLRMMPASCISSSYFFSSNFATFFASKFAKAFLKFALFLSTVSRLSPAWKLSNTKNSKSLVSSWTGVHRSLS